VHWIRYALKKTKEPEALALQPMVRKYSVVPRLKQPQRGLLPVSCTGKEGLGFDRG